MRQERSRPIIEALHGWLNQQLPRISNGLNPLAYLTDVLERIVAGRTKITEIEALLPWSWQPTGQMQLPAAA